MKKSIFLFGVILLALLMAGVNVNAQTYRYKLVKKVNRNTGEEFAVSGNARFLYVTFYNNKKSFVFSDQDGNYLPNNFSKPDLSPYMGYTNNGRGGMRNIREFNYSSTNNNGVLVFVNNRPSLRFNDDAVLGYIKDYINFSNDYKRFNIVDGGTDSENGYPDGRSINLVIPSYMIEVYQRVANAPNTNGNTSDFY